MKTRMTHASRLAILTAGVAGVLASGFVPAPAQAQQAQNEPPKGWYKTCAKQQDVDICSLQNVIIDQSGVVVAGVSLIEVSGKVNNKVMQIVVPTYRLVPPGVTVQVDNNKARKVDYSMCLPDRCIAEAPLSDDLINAFKRGQGLTLTSVNFQNQPSTEQMTLSGFTDAYDGPPLAQDKVDARQEQLDQFVNNNKDEFNKRYIDAQKKALEGDK